MLQREDKSYLTVSEARRIKREYLANGMGINKGLGLLHVLQDLALHDGFTSTSRYRCELLEQYYLWHRLLDVAKGKRTYKSLLYDFWSREAIEIGKLLLEDFMCYVNHVIKGGK